MPTVGCAKVKKPTTKTETGLLWSNFSYIFQLLYLVPRNWSNPLVRSRCQVVMIQMYIESENIQNYNSSFTRSIYRGFNQKEQSPSCSSKNLAIINEIRLSLLDQLTKKKRCNCIRSLINLSCFCNPKSHHCFISS